MSFDGCLCSVLQAGKRFLGGRGESRQEREKITKLNRREKKEDKGSPTLNDDPVLTATQC